ncbi:hypothetical protein [Coleofasciculus sp. E2-BRE-01]|uniref:hypothetical protein n=1 Tax=Coleofasciculus sp. E2-BRE-01 TaxID=3069524 RepID=UPI0032F80CC3
MGSEQDARTTTAFGYSMARIRLFVQSRILDLPRSVTAGRESGCSVRSHDCSGYLFGRMLR